jgi:hypothetical protein
MRRHLFVSLLALLCAATAFGQLPDVTGKWHQVGLRGRTATEEIRFQGLDLIVKSRIAEVVTPGSTLRAPTFSGSSEQTFHLDGIERSSKNESGPQSWRTAGWHGSELVIETVVKDGYRVTVTRESWALSEDGGTLTKSTRVVDMDGVRERTATFQRD